MPPSPKKETSCACACVVQIINIALNPTTSLLSLSRDALENKTTEVFCFAFLLQLHDWRSLLAKAE